MDLLLDLPYKKFDGFFIQVSRIAYGWMDFDIGINGTFFHYGASYLGDPLNDLLEAAVSIVKETKSTEHFNGVTYSGDYFYITHELEPDLVTWLFRYTQDDLTLIIWKDKPEEFDMLIENDFNSQELELQMIDKIPDLSDGLVFAVKDLPIPFIRGLIDTISNVQNLERYPEGDDDRDWGFNYSVENLNILKEWLSKKEIKI